MTIAIWIGFAFVLAALITSLTKAPPVPTGLLLPVPVGAAAIVYVMYFVPATASNSTAPVIIPFAFAWTLLGTLPGALIGPPLRDAFTRLRRSSRD